MPRNSNQSKASNYSIDFNGSSNSITCGNLPQLQGATNASFSMWVNVASSGVEYFFSQWGSGTDRLIRTFVNGLGTSSNQFDIYINDTISFRASNNSIIESLATGEWFNLVITYDGTESTSSQRVKVYINNQELTGNIFGGPTSLYSSTTDFIIGAYPSGASYFEGKISQFCIFDYTLSTNQISALYNSGIPSNPLAVTTPPIAYYDLGQGSAYASGSAGIIEPNLAAATGSTVFDFDGIEDYIDCGNSDTFTFGNGTTDSPFSISAWFNADVLSSANRFVISKFGTAAQREYLLELSSGNVSMVLCDTSNSSNRITVDHTTGVTFETGRWYNIAFTYDGSGTTGGADIYVDGIVASTATKTKSVGYVAMGNKSAPLKIGERSGKEFDGQASNVQIWNTNLQGSNMATLYNNGTPLQSYTDIPQSGSLEAWYKLGQSANWEADTAGNWQIPDAVSSYPKSFDFTGVNGVYIDAGNDNSINFTSAFSTSLWFKTTSSATMYTSHGSVSVIKYFIQFYAPINRLRLRIYDGGGGNVTVNNTQVFNDGKWHHLAFTTDGTTSADKVIVYFDGQPLPTTGTLPNNGIKNLTAGSLKIGAYVTTQNTFNGQLSNFQTWGTELSSLEVETLYNNGVPLTTAIATDNLKAWYKLDNTATFSTNWSVPDASGNGNTGTSSGMTEQNLVFNNVSALNGESSGMDSTNLVPSNLIKSIPYSGYSMEFHGTDDYITASYSGDVYACSIWFKPENTITTSTATEYLISFGNEYDGVLLGSSTSGLTDELITINNDVGGIGRSAYTASSGTISDSFHHLCFNWSGTVYQIWLDGVNVQNVSNGTPALIASTAVQIGRNSLVASTVRDFNGNISNTAIFDRTLTQDEIIRIYNGGSPGNLSSLNPTSWWSLGSDSYFNGSNWVCPDIGSNSNDGTSVNLGAEDLKGNGPDSLANGTSTNLDLSSDLVGNAPGSTGNAISVNMNFTARTGSTP